MERYNYSSAVLRGEFIPMLLRVKPTHCRYKVLDQRYCRNVACCGTMGVESQGHCSLCHSYCRPGASLFMSEDIYLATESFSTARTCCGGRRDLSCYSHQEILPAEHLWHHCADYLTLFEYYGNFAYRDQSLARRLCFVLCQSALS